MMRKILCILITVILLLSVVPSFAYGEEAIDSDVIKYSNEINELKVIGIIDYEISGEELISRGEFAYLLVRFMGIDPSMLNEPDQLFYDVPVTHKYFQAISYCARQGYMIGYGNNIFQPDKKIIPEEIIKPIIAALGYSYKAVNYGNNFSAYMTVAKELGLLKGIELPYGEGMFHEEAAKLLHNVLEVPVVRMIGMTNDDFEYIIDKNKTVLSEYHKLRRTKGIMTATDVTGILGYAVQDDEKCVIGGHVYKMTDPLMRTYLGKKVEIVYSIEETTQDEIIICQLIKDSDKSLKISKEEFRSISSGKFNYIDADDRARSVNIGMNFDFVYNGKSKIYEEKLIRDANYGFFELLSSEGNGRYDIVIFNEYRTLTVEMVSQLNETIYGMDSTDRITYNQTDDIIIFVDEAGNIIDINNILKNDVLTYYKNGNYIYGIVSRKMVSGIITQKNSADSEIFIDDIAYKFSGDKDSLESSISSIRLNNEIYAYLDAFSNIAGMTLVEIGKIENTYIPIGMFRKNLGYELCPAIKVFDLSDMKMKTFLFADKIMLNNDDKEPKSEVKDKDDKTDYDRIEEAVKGSSVTPIMMELNSEGNIKSIQTPKKASVYGENKDGFITMVDETYVNGSLNNKLTFKKSISAFSSDAYVNEQTKFFVVPDNIASADESEFVEIQPPTDYVLRPVYIYSDSKDNPYATLVLYKNSDFYAMGTSGRVYAVIKKITQVEVDGCTYNKFYCENNGVEYTFLTNEMSKTDDYTAQPPIKVEDLGRGDIVTFVTDNNGILKQFDCVWRWNEKSDGTIEGILKSEYQKFLTDENRIFQAKVLGIDSEFIKVEGDITEKSTTIKGKKEFLKYDASTPVTIIHSNGNSYSATLSDISIEDTIVTHSLSYKLKHIFVIKD